LFFAVILTLERREGKAPVFPPPQFQRDSLVLTPQMPISTSQASNL